MSAAILFFLAIQTADANNEIVARVGDYLISKKDVEFRDQVIRQRYPGETRALGLEQLCRSYEFAAALKKLGQPITPKSLEQEEMRIEKATQAPGQLQKIRAIFLNDRESYRKNFVLPVLAERLLPFDIFPHTTVVHAESRHLAQDLLESVLKYPEKFESLANQRGLRVVPMAVTSSGMAYPGDAEYRLKKIHLELKSGQVLSKVLERPQFWIVVKYLGQSQKKNHLVGAIVPKKDFFTWWVEEKRRDPAISCQRINPT